jgi:hypothetical protein
VGSFPRRQGYSLRDGWLFIAHMKKTKGVRISADKQGNIEVTFTLPAESVAKADEWAARLPSTREEVIARYIADCAKTIHEGIKDHCLVAWSFETPKQVKSFIKREHLDRKGIGVMEFSDGSFGVDTRFKYEALLTR